MVDIQYLFQAYRIVVRLHSTVSIWFAYSLFQNPDILRFYEELQLLDADYSCHLVAESETSLRNTRRELTFLKLMKEEGMCVVEQGVE